MRRPEWELCRRALLVLFSPANHSDSSGLARSLALSFSRVAAARRIPVLPQVLHRNSGFLARARHARGNDRKIRPSGHACHYFVQDSNRFRLFLTLAGIVAACSLVLVISASLLIETARANVPSYNPFSVQAIVLSFLVVITASLVWCLRKARQKPTRSGSVVFGATTFGSVAVTLFAICIWVSSLGTPTSGSTERSVIQATPPRDLGRSQNYHRRTAQCP